MGFRTRNGTKFDNTSIAHILKKLHIYSKKTKMVTYIDRRTGSEQITQCYIYTEEDKNKIIRYAEKTYRNINKETKTIGKQIEISNAEIGKVYNIDDNNSTEMKKLIKELKEDIIKSLLNIKLLPEKNEHYYKGAFESLQKMYNELSSKYDNLHTQYVTLLEKNAQREEPSKKSFWRR